MCRLAPWLLASLLLAACGEDPPPAPVAAKETSGAEVAAPAAKPEPAAPAVPAPLAELVDAGSLARSDVLAVLEEGAGRFLQKLQAKPHLEGGRFIGWRLVRLFDERPAMRGAVLQPGDTLRSVNGQSIERPEEFLHVWNAMRSSGELVLLIRREGRESTVRYEIKE